VLPKEKLVCDRQDFISFATVYNLEVVSIPMSGILVAQWLQIE